MAIAGIQNLIPGAVAGGDMSAKQFHFAKVHSSTGKFVAPTAAGLACEGVFQNAPAGDGHAASIAPVQSGEVSKLKLGSAVTAGAKLYSDAGGAGVTGATGSNVALATALEAGASGAIVSVLLAAPAII